MAQISLTEPLVKFAGTLIILLSAYLVSRNNGDRFTVSDGGVGIVPPNWRKISTFRGAARVAMEAELHRARTVFARLNKPIAVSLDREKWQSQVRVHPTRRYNVTSRIASRPKVHPRGETVHELSFFVTRTDLDTSTSDAIVHCLCRATGTTKDEWGLFNAEQFTPERTQLEYFVSLPSSGGPTLAELISKIRAFSGGQLDKCVRNRTSKFGPNAKIHYARKAVRSQGVQNGMIGEETWVIAGLMAMVVTVFVEVTVLLRLRARKRKLKAMRGGRRARDGLRGVARTAG